MTRPAGDTGAQLCLTRRIARLFRIERVGRLERRTAATARHLIERRGALIDALIATAEWRSVGTETGSPALDRALRELAFEIGQCRPPVERRLRELAVELRLRRGGTPASGVRRNGGGRILGSG